MSTRSKIFFLAALLAATPALADGPINGGASGKSTGFISTGSSPTGTTGSCGGTVTMTGGATAGTWSSTAICAITTGTIILTGLPAAPHGWSCDANDQTTAAVVLQETATSATSVTWTVRATATAANDVINFKCMGY